MTDKTDKNDNLQNGGLGGNIGVLFSLLAIKTCIMKVFAPQFERMESLCFLTRKNTTYESKITG